MNNALSNHSQSNYQQPHPFNLSDIQSSTQSHTTSHNNHFELLQYIFSTPSPSHRSSNHSFDSSAFDIQQYPLTKTHNKHFSSSIKIKRTRKMKEIQVDQCSICLSEIKDQCNLQCSHKFCLLCVEEWFRHSNKCPYCRSQVQRYWNKGQFHAVQSKEFEYEGDSVENFDWICYNCSETQQGDIVLICDNCEAQACHIECDEQLNGIQPAGDWFCHNCR